MGLDEGRFIFLHVVVGARRLRRRRALVLRSEPFGLGRPASVAGARRETLGRHWSLTSDHFAGPNPSDHECLRFKELKRQFLCKHDIAGHEIALREKAPFANAPATLIKLIDIHRIAVMNAVAMPRGAADDIEEAMVLMLLELRRRKVRLKQPPASSPR
jgi:hypothetical protein